MNTYDPIDEYKTTFASTMIIDLETDNKIVYIVFNPLESDGEHSLLAEIFTAYKDYGSPSYDSGLPCNPGDEMAIREMVIANIESGNIVWAEREDENIVSEYYNGAELSDEKIVKAIRQAANDYEDGAILEAKETLMVIIEAIDDFEDDFEDDEDED